MQISEVINNYQGDILRDIIFIYNNSYPLSWQCTDDDEYYKEMLLNRNNIHIFLKDYEKSVGYLHAIQHNDAVKELSNDDPAIKEDRLMYYIETVCILPEYRARQGFSKLLATLLIECKKRGINKVSLHARVTNHLSEIIQVKFNTAPLRRIEKWKYYNFEEPADYFEVSFK
jgi:ribosomal protein S18 acetylase RimI-like enzyme